MGRKSSIPRGPVELLHVQTPAHWPRPFCAGVELRDGVCVRAAPILRWLVGLHRDDALQRLRRKRFEVELKEVK